MARNLDSATTNENIETSTNTIHTRKSAALGTEAVPNGARKRNRKSILGLGGLPLLLLVLLTSAGCLTNLTVRRHSTIPVSNALASSILGDFSSAVNTADTPTDFACAGDFGTIGTTTFMPAFYMRDGNVTTYAGVANINSAANFTAVIGTPGYAKVVNSINWCGALIPNVIGCAPVPGNSFTVVRFTANQEGILWAHEFGHTVSRPHRNGPTTIMNSFISVNQLELNANECFDFVSLAVNNPLTPKAATAGAAGGAQMIVDGELAQDIDPKISLLKFVQRVHPHGTPMGFAMRFEGSPQIRELEAMLQNPKEAQWWGNVAAVLGMIGDRSASPQLIGFIQSQMKQVPEDDGVRPLTAALMGLGYLVNQTGDSDALNFLAAASSSKFWGNFPQACGRGWTAEDNCAGQLATGAAIGLGLSGSGAAQQVLNDAYRDALNAGDKDLAENLLAYLEVNAEIAQTGLSAYYPN
jgi:hypothetical protein